MYLDDESIEKGVLRQGDIIADVHLLGAININSIQYSSTVGSEPNQYVSWSIPSSPKYGDAMVLSHSCEIDPGNKIKLTSIILAPLRDINTATAQEKIQDLIDSNEIDRTEPQASYLKYFYVYPNENLKFHNGAIVDFSKCFSLRRQSYDILLINKIAQLNNEATLSMALKLALYFHRDGNALNGKNYPKSVPFD
jgi:hypothetical protein